MPSQRSARMRWRSSLRRTWRGKRARRGRARRRVASTRCQATYTENRRSEVAACSSRGAARPHQQARASAGACGSSGRRARTPCRGQVRECVGDAQGASAHRVNEAPEDDDAKDRSFKAGIYVQAVGCARTPRCGQVSACVDEAQEDPENEGENAAAGAFSTPVERLRQKARLSARGQDTPSRRARTTRRGTPVKRANKAQEKNRTHGQGECGRRPLCPGGGGAEPPATPVGYRAQS